MSAPTGFRPITSHQPVFQGRQASPAPVKFASLELDEEDSYKTHMEQFQDAFDEYTDTLFQATDIDAETVEDVTLKYSALVTAFTNAPAAKQAEMIAFLEEQMKERKPMLLGSKTFRAVTAHVVLRRLHPERG